MVSKGYGQKPPFASKIKDPKVAPTKITDAAPANLLKSSNKRPIVGSQTNFLKPKAKGK